VYVAGRATRLRGLCGRVGGDAGLAASFCSNSFAFVLHSTALTLVVTCARSPSALLDNCALAQAMMATHASRYSWALASWPRVQKWPHLLRLKLKPFGLLTSRGRDALRLTGTPLEIPCQR
jgi:hypothetical protein